MMRMESGSELNVLCILEKNRMTIFRLHLFGYLELVNQRDHAIPWLRLAT